MSYIKVLIHESIAKTVKPDTKLIDYLKLGVENDLFRRALILKNRVLKPVCFRCNVTAILRKPKKLLASARVAQIALELYKEYLTVPWLSLPPQNQVYV